VALLTGSTATAARRGSSRRWIGRRHLVVSTTLVQGDQSFHQLGLVVIDEQHRFGVLQRATLRQRLHLTSSS
jgi:ATP-dependent DNA helicase RecG